MAYMTPDENDRFKLLCDEIMRTTQPDIVAALQAWFRGNAEGLPVVMTEITTTARTYHRRVSRRDGRRHRAR